MLRIEIMNLMFDSCEFDYDFRIDRRSELGNPFYMDNEDERDLAYEAHRAWFHLQLENPNSKVSIAIEELKTALQRYGKLRLFCCCAPKRCHGETISAYLENF